MILRRIFSFLLRPAAPVVAVLRLHGVIGRAGPLRSGLTLRNLAEPIERAFSLGHLKAVAVSINSPGGSPVQSALIAGRVRALAREKNLPVFSFVEDVAASGGYWLACAADEIFADTNSIIGSIGVVSAGFGFPEALKKLGIERRIYAEGQNKAILDPFKPEDADEVERLKLLQRDVHQSFKDHVRDRRGKRLKGDDETLFNGDIWTGGRALDLGLVDGIGDMRAVLRERFGDKVRLRVISAPKRWLRRKLGLAAFGTDELVLNLFEALETRALWSRYGL
ncbi:MAG: S49 family peptidase [Alphaproteobacteria bacterium]